MNPTLGTLREQIPDLPADPDAVAALLRERGFDVLRVAPLAELLEPVVVARVTAVDPHPNADRLKVCTVDDGSGEPLQVVTGADNVHADGFYPLIRHGVILPNGTKIKRGRLRGEASEGMLGSADELELGSDHAGLLELQGPELSPGEPVTGVVDAPGVVFVLAGKPSLEEIVTALRGQEEKAG